MNSPDSRPHDTSVIQPIYTNNTSFGHIFIHLELLNVSRSSHLINHQDTVRPFLLNEMDGPILHHDLLAMRWDSRRVGTVAIHRNGHVSHLDIQVKKTCNSWCQLSKNVLVKTAKQGLGFNSRPDSNEKFLIVRAWLNLANFWAPLS
ncbi:hypothetical protein OUZ56_001779 [Daphnia magna]|uniref:Uncharacterized protein n=1 Tax=Daphnia magna TaxID=35525 RepID=A0ABR0A3Q2_9CRUS|nr:hypothetical protein OUZ56_001779 [Daphnia magna]